MYIFGGKMEWLFISRNFEFSIHWSTYYNMQIFVFLSRSAQISLKSCSIRQGSAASLPWWWWSCCTACRLSWWRGPTLCCSTSSSGSSPASPSVASSSLSLSWVTVSYVCFDPNWVRLALNVLNLIWKISRICLNWGQSNPLYIQIWTFWDTPTLKHHKT